MKDLELARKENKDKAIELFATNPDIGITKVAEMIGVRRETVHAWRRDPNFHQKVLNRFNIELEGELPNMLSALKRECLAGNINGMKLMLEYMNKLQKNINLVVLSPYEKWLQSKDINSPEAAEIVVDDVDVLDEFKSLPPRTEKNKPMEIHKERVKLKNAHLKEKSIKKRNDARREAYKWSKRAKLAGIEPLPAKRPTPNQKKEWQDKVIAAENQASQSLQAQVGNNKTPCKPKNQKQEAPKTPTPPKT